VPPELIVTWKVSGPTAGNPLLGTTPGVHCVASVQFPVPPIHADLIADPRKGASKRINAAI